MFVHFAPNTWQDAESDNLTTPLSEIDPKKLDTDQWAKAAVGLGARYIVFVAKHQGGFCMWQTETTGYSIRNTPWRGGHGDVMADVSASCRKYGLKLGVYVCPRDDHFGAKTGGICKTPELQFRYNAMYRQQLTEVLSRYGEMVEVWFDGSTATPVERSAGEVSTARHGFSGPCGDYPLGRQRGWLCAESLLERYRPGRGKDRHGDFAEQRPRRRCLDAERGRCFDTPPELVLEHEECEQSAHPRSAALRLLPFGRTRRAAAAEYPRESRWPAPGSRLRLGERLRQRGPKRFAKPLAETAGQGAELTLTLTSPTRIDTVILQEEIAKGERIRKYRIEGLSGGTWRPLGEGTSVGHKRIQPVGPITVDALRVVTTQSAGTPIFRTLAVFNTAAAPAQRLE